jgi:outer membrane protein OmpA-like peptidoglycan-associated protein/opacity protein-like surface antigen
MKSKIIVGLCSGVVFSAAAPMASAQAPAPAPAPAADTSASGSLSVSSSDGMSASGDASAEGEKPDSAYEPHDMEWNVGAAFTLMFPASDHNLRHEDERPQEYGLAPGIAVRMAFFPIRYAGLELEGGWWHTSTKDDSSAALFAGRAHAFLQFPIGRIVPFAVVGLGALGAGSNPMGTDTDPAFHFGLGAKYALTEALSVRLDLRDTMAQRAQTAEDPAAEQGDLTHFPEVMLGVSLALDPRHEECAEPAAAGPKDSDHDGFVDPSDKCPTQPGIAPDGCPDKDSDGDGLLDSKDACPTESGPASTGGCPIRDTDKDGIPDDFDKCPNEPGPINGCPDLDPDKDGVNAPNDKCPDQAEIKNGFDDEDGCPDEIPEKIRKFTGVIKGIEFDTGKDTIRAASDGVLNGALIVLQEYPKTRIEISGHTDDVGKPEDNMDLSRRRAESVKNWFVTKGIDAKRIETKGAGPTEPIADNKGPVGRQKNRRIEFKLIQ